MSVRSEDDDTEFRTVGMDATDLRRYAEITLEDGDVVIYDQDNEDGWVQSGSAVDLEAMA